MEGARVAGRQPFMPRKALAFALAALRFARQATDDMRGRFTAPTRGPRSLAKRATACSVPAQAGTHSSDRGRCPTRPCRNFAEIRHQKSAHSTLEFVYGPITFFDRSSLSDITAMHVLSSQRETSASANLEAMGGSTRTSP